MNTFMKIAATCALASPLALGGCMAASDGADLSEPVDATADAIGPVDCDAGLDQQETTPCLANTFVAPSSRSPETPSPLYPAPHFGAPQHQAPVYKAPVYKAPQYQNPADLPVYDAPIYSAPTYPGPKFQAPIYEAPVYDAPSFPAAIFESPTYEGCKDLNQKWMTEPCEYLSPMIGNVYGDLGD